QTLIDKKGPVALALADQLPAPELAESLFQLLAPRLERVPATLTFEKREYEAARQAARDSVPIETDVYKPGELLVPQDRPIDPEQLALLHKEHEEFVARRGTVDRVRRAGGLTGLVFALYALAGYYIVRFERRLARSWIRLTLLAALIVAALGV